MLGLKKNPLEHFLQATQSLASSPSGSSAGLVATTGDTGLPACVVLDGGLATELENRGACLRDPLWSAKLLSEDPDLIREVHRDYFFAGADVAITASYQASHEAFQRRGHSEEQASGLMTRSVTLACQARDEFWAAGPWPGRVFPLVVASVGSYGAFLADGSEYRGNYTATQEELKAFHRLRLQVLAETETDLVAIETIPCLREAQAILELLSSEFPHMWAWLCFSCKDESHVSEGQTLLDCAALADKFPQCVAVGVNCSAPRYILPLLQSAAKATSKPLVAYPNSGETWDGLNKVWLVRADDWTVGSCRLALCQ
eukprot:jgi/Mesvir1/26876/Mv20614-RA.2